MPERTLGSFPRVDVAFAAEEGPMVVPIPLCCRGFGARGSPGRGDGVRCSERVGGTEGQVHSVDDRGVVLARGGDNLTLRHNPALGQLQQAAVAAMGDTPAVDGSCLLNKLLLLADPLPRRLLPG